MILTFILWVLGLLSTFYFVIYILAIGLNNVFTYFWLIFGGLLIGTGIIRSIMHSKNITLPKQVCMLLYLCTIAVCAVFIVTEFTIVINGAKEPQDEADYVIILGARVNGTKVSKNLSYRLDAALSYLKDNPDSGVIVSGGQGSGEDITEAEAMKEYLMKRGIKAERIIKEDKSVNTYQNIKFSMDIIGNMDAEVVLVTNNFHVYRAEQIAKKQGCKSVSGIGAKTHVFTVPNSYVRECFAVIKYKLFGQI